MAYGTGSAPAKDSVDTTYEAVIHHTSDCLKCNDGTVCATGNRLRAAHRRAQVEARR